MLSVGKNDSTSAGERAAVRITTALRSRLRTASNVSWRTSTRYPAAPRSFPRTEPGNPLRVIEPTTRARYLSGLRWSGDGHRLRGPRQRPPGLRRKRANVPHIPWGRRGSVLDRVLRMGLRRLARPVLPSGDRPGGIPQPLRPRVPGRRGRLELLPGPEPVPGPAVGGADARRLPLRAQGASGRDPRVGAAGSPRRIGPLPREPRTAPLARQARTGGPSVPAVVPGDQREAPSRAVARGNPPRVRAGGRAPSRVVVDRCDAFAPRGPEGRAGLVGRARDPTSRLGDGRLPLRSVHRRPGSHGVRPYPTGCAARGRRDEETLRERGPCDLNCLRVRQQPLHGIRTGNGGGDRRGPG